MVQYIEVVDYVEYLASKFDLSICMLLSGHRARYIAYERGLFRIHEDRTLSIDS